MQTLLDKNRIIMHQHKVIRCFNFSLTALLLGPMFSCSTFNDKFVKSDPTQQHSELNYNAINQYVKEWEEAKPKVERLGELEHDLALIIKEVGKLSTIKNMPPQFAQQQVTDYIQAEYDDIEIDNSTFNNAQLPEETTNSDSKRQIYATHLAFFLKEDNAKVGWNILKKRYPQILDGLTPVVEKINRHQQTIFSLRVGPFDKEENAKIICSIFSQYKYKCDVTDFSGNSILI
jgi:spore coat protein CotF